MRRSHAVHLVGPVGQEGANSWHDVAAIQQLLNELLPTPMRRLAVDGDCGPLTIAVITECQRRYLHMTSPDGRIDPHGPTLRMLNKAERVAPPPVHVLTHHAPTPRSAVTPPTAARPMMPHAPATPARGGHGRQPPADVVAAAQASQRAWRIPASVSIAQWALESAWGRSMPIGSNNPFGIKARRGEPYVTTWTHEVINHRRVRVQADFRAFASMDEAFERHGRLLAQGLPYTAARIHLDDPDAFADALTGVYATDPGYGLSLRSLMRSNDFYQYDQPVPAAR